MYQQGPQQDELVAFLSAATGSLYGLHRRRRRRRWVPPIVTLANLCRQERRRLERAGKLPRL